MYIRTLHIKELVKNFLALLFPTLLLLYPEVAARAAKDGLHLFLYLLLPSLFPFAVIASYLAGRMPIPKAAKTVFSGMTGLSEPACTPFLLGLIAGFPVGARLTAEAVKSKALSRAEGNHLLPLCTACSPLFVIGVLGGGMLGSFQTGYLLYSIQLLALLLTNLLFKKLAPYSRQTRQQRIPPMPLTQAVETSMKSLLSVCGFVMLFQVICDLLRVTGAADNLCPYPPLLYGLLEISSGCNRIVLSELPAVLKLSLLSGICSFSGICVMLQVSAAVQDASLSMRRYIGIKCVSALLAFGLAFVSFPFLPVETFSIPIQSDSFAFPTAFLLLSGGLFCVSAIFLAVKRKFKVHTFDNR